jgi:hypothetical protein
LIVTSSEYARAISESAGCGLRCAGDAVIRGERFAGSDAGSTLGKDDKKQGIDLLPLFPHKAVPAFILMGTDVDLPASILNALLTQDPGSSAIKTANPHHHQGYEKWRPTSTGSRINTA